MLHSNQPDIVALHHEYRRLTGIDIGLDFWRERVWSDWLRKGWTKADLALVVAHLKKGIRDGTRNMGALKFHNLIAQPDYFEEDLAVARALAREKKETNRDKILAATGREAEKPKDARPVADILAGEKAFAEFKKLKELL